MSSHPLIIERPELQSHVQRYGWSSVTFVFWVVYVYLWVPLLTLAAWWVGTKLFNFHMIQLQGYAGLIDKLTLYALIIFIISAILIGWAEMNRLRFKNQLRRMENVDVTVYEVAEKYDLDAEKLTELRQKKSMTVYFSDNGTISDIREYELIHS